MQPPPRLRKQTLSAPQKPPDHHFPNQPSSVFPGPIHVFDFYGNYSRVFPYGFTTR